MTESKLRKKQGNRVYRVVAHMLFGGVGSDDVFLRQTEFDRATRILDPIPRLRKLATTSMENVLRAALWQTYDIPFLYKSAY